MMINPVHFQPWSGNLTFKLFSMGGGTGGGTLWVSLLCGGRGEGSGLVLF